MNNGEFVWLIKPSFNSELFVENVENGQLYYEFTDKNKDASDWIYNLFFIEIELLDNQGF